MTLPIEIDICQRITKIDFYVAFASASFSEESAELWKPMWDVQQVTRLLVLYPPRTTCFLSRAASRSQHLITPSDDTVIKTGIDSFEDCGLETIIDSVLTRSLWPASSATQSPVSASQTRAVLSSCPVTMYDLSFFREV